MPSGIKILKNRENVTLINQRTFINQKEDLIR